MSKHDQHLPFSSQLFQSPSNSSASRPSTFSSRRSTGRRQRTRRPLEDDPARHPSRHAARPITRPRRAEPRTAAQQAEALDPVSIPQIAGVAFIVISFFTAVLFL